MSEAAKLTDEELDQETRKRIQETPDKLIDVINWVRSQRPAGPGDPGFGIKEGWDYVKARCAN